MPPSDQVRTWVLTEDAKGTPYVLLAASEDAPITRIPVVEADPVRDLLERTRLQLPVSGALYAEVQALLKTLGSPDSE